MMADLVRTGTGVARRALVPSNRAEYLAFTLADGTYAVPIANVGEILKLPPVTVVPRAAPEILGVVSVRGLLVTVIDLRLRLKVPASPACRSGRVLLVTGVGGEVIGLYVDDVLQVYRLADGEIEPATTALGGGHADHVVGIGRSEGVLLVLLDLAPIVGCAPGGTRDA
jgi:purine-binding chemotaxis protein CheW